MVVSAQFKETSGQDHVCHTSDAGPRRVQFWLHQRTRLADGYVTIDADGTNRIVLNWITKGKPADIAARALYKTVARQTEGGMTVWTDAQVSALLSEMNVPQSET